MSNPMTPRETSGTCGETATSYGIPVVCILERGHVTGHFFTDRKDTPEPSLVLTGSSAMAVQLSAQDKEIAALREQLAAQSKQSLDFLSEEHNRWLEEKFELERVNADLNRQLELLQKLWTGDPVECEASLIVNILRTWERDRIKRFALHLLGEKADLGRSKA